MNKVFLIGRITKNPELRRTQSGKSVVSFTLAIDNPRIKDSTDYPNCVAWERVADLINTYVTKGQRIAVSGRLTTRNYQSKGQKVYVTEVMVEEVEFLDKRNQSVFQERQAVQPDFAEITDDEVPF